MLLLLYVLLLCAVVCLCDMRRTITRAAFTPACLTLCRSALGFVSPALQQPNTGNRRQQFPAPGRGTAGVAVVAPLSLTLPWPFANLPWGRKAGEEEEASPPGSGGLALDKMSSPNDDRHGPPSIRNRGFILEELSKWEGGGGGSEGSMLDIASGTGCHVEAFAKALPGWTFQPSEVRREHNNKTHHSNTNTSSHTTVQRRDEYSGSTRADKPVRRGGGENAFSRLLWFYSYICNKVGL